MSSKKTSKPSSKTPAKKAPPKPAPKKTPAKPAPKKTPPAKAKAPAKKAPAKPAPKKAPPKPAPKKTPVAAKAPAKPAPKPQDKNAAKKDSSAHKPITVVKKASKPPLKKPEEPTMFENQSQDFAFAFAEQMKRRDRADEERKRSEATTIRLSRRPTTRTKGKNTQQFPAADLAEFRKRLILLRQEALGQSATLRTIALEQTDERGSEDEDGSDVFMRLQNLSQVDSQNKVIQKIDEALHRIADGTYGICEMCGQLIRKPRLMNLPFVHTCMECQSEMENPSR